MYPQSEKALYGHPRRFNVHGISSGGPWRFCWVSIVSNGIPWTDSRCPVGIPGRFQDVSQGMRRQWELGKGIPYQGKQCAGSHGNLNTCLDNPYSSRQRAARFRAALLTCAVIGSSACTALHAYAVRIVAQA